VVLPQLPRLAHQALSAGGARDRRDSEIAERLLRAQSRTLRLIAILLAAILVALLLQAAA
jgi:hypothetical protein